MWTKELVRWVVKSGVGLAINLALLTAWVDHVGIPAEIAIWINWLLLSVYGYVLAGQWVFNDTKAVRGVWGHLKQWGGMQAVMGLGKALNFVVYYALLAVAVDYRVAWVAGAVVALVVSFGGNREWWRSETTVQQ